ncbi:MAG: alpha/beta hydrolase [Sphingobium sp.]|uniref:alpha/beta hydrolase n=1 Tax=Sphingobium sp. CECT 9361 TaxID=2845384 RepID=UPI001E64200F|nr:alpha/beta hydrolase [Sphingobium sp. CECT 9361]CAH0351295.1 Acetyl esterase [Sphingobium sp. CECT 9361]
MVDKGEGKLHPDMQAMLDRRAALGLPGFAAGSPDDARRTFAQSQTALPPDRGAHIALVEDIAIPAAHGAIAARRYIARPGAVGGRILYFHGGGWVFGTLDGFDAVCRDLAQATGAEIISVDYRLAPEHRFPAAIDDGWTALLAYSDARPLAVMGDSAGGNIAAALALRARDMGGPSIDLQILLYPVLSPDFERESVTRYGGGDHFISRADLAWFWDHYVPGDQRTTPYAAPLAAEGFQSLPPAIMVLAGCDPLHDEGEAYARALDEAGVTVTLRDHADMAHGFFTLVGLLKRADEEVSAVGTLIRTQFASTAVIQPEAR